MKVIMKYEALVKDISNNEIETVKMIDGSLIKCKKVPLATIDTMDNFLVGIKEGLNISNGALSYIATIGNTKLYSAVGDASTYMRNKNGNLLSAAIGSNGKISGQPGFQEVELAEKGLKVASKMAKAIPWVAIAVTVIEVGTKIVANQSRIKAEQIAIYDKYSEINEDHINNLWQAMNDYTLFKGDEAHRTANILRINNALDESRNAFRKLLKDASKNKKIDEHLVFALKTALDVYSFAHLLNIMYAKVDNIPELIDDALKNIDERTSSYSEILERCYVEHVTSKDKHNKVLEKTQFDNSTTDKKKIATRVALDFLTLGATELGSLGSKGIGKKVQQKDQEIITSLEECKKANNPFAECIRNADELLLCNKIVMRDDKYHYYEA